jgi:hypothetical protein
MCSIAPQFEYFCSVECAWQAIGDEESGSYPDNVVSEFRSEECTDHEVGGQSSRMSGTASEFGSCWNEFLMDQVPRHAGRLKTG